VSQVGQFVADGVDEAGVLERLAGPGVVQPDQNPAVVVADSVAALDVRSLGEISRKVRLKCLAIRSASRRRRSISSEGSGLFLGGENRRAADRRLTLLTCLRTRW